MTLTEWFVVCFLVLQVVLARIAAARFRSAADSYEGLYRRAEKHVDELLSILKSKQQAPEFDPWPVHWQENDEEKN